MMNNDQQAWKGVIDRYYTPDEQAEWQQAMSMAGADDLFLQQDYQAQWNDLGQRITAALPLDPDSDAALGFVREWFALLEPFSRVATPSMWKRNFAMFEDMRSWEGQADPGFSAEVWGFIHAATTCALSAGHDIGPVPEWFGASSAGETQ